MAMLDNYDQHVQQYGPPSNHPYADRNDPGAGGCPLLGNQCPVKADLATSYNDDFGFPDYPVYMKEYIAKSKLLTMEDIERRKMEDEMEYGDYNGPPIPAPSTSSQNDSSNVGHMGVGMMSAIQNSVKKESNDSGPPPARPAMGGLMTELQNKANSDNDKHPPESPTKKKRGLLAAITGRGRK